METGSRQSALVVELTEGQELLRQLEAQLDQPSGIDVCKSLASSILSSIEKALRIARSSGAGDDSGRSPRSENSVRAAMYPDRREMPKKRKTEPKWTNQVRVSSGDGVDGPLADGYSWRKYGQKKILGAEHPRGSYKSCRSYYRCSHRNTRGCPAIKQVQQSDDKPSVFNVTYRGTHTCIHEWQEQRQDQLDQQENGLQHQHHHQLLLSFQTGLRVKTTGSSCSEGQGPASRSFSSTQFGHPTAEPRGFNDCFIDNISPSFISQAASESDFAEILSSSTSGPNSPMLDMDFMIDPVEFEPSFAFDASTFFPFDS